MRRSTTPEIYDEEEDPCTICHEEMKPGTTKMLECKHYFHDRVSETLWIKKRRHHLLRRNIFMDFFHIFYYSASDNGIGRKTSVPFVASTRRSTTSFRPCNCENKYTVLLGVQLKTDCDL